jgi:hypothetical protein
MPKKTVALAFVIGGLALPIGFAAAGVLVAPPPIPVRIANSEVVFVGKVVALEPVGVDAKTFPTAKESTKYTIAVVNVSKIINGLKDEKMLRVGFIAKTKPGPIGLFNPKLTVGQEGLFMISKHAEGKFYQAPINGYFISEQQKTFDDDIALAKKAVIILNDTKGALKSKDADLRLMAAAMVVAKYRTQKPPFPNKEEAIDADESKLILNAISDAKWVPVKFGEVNPQQVFFQLGVGPKDGWKAPMKISSPDDMRIAVQAWIRDHSDYRIKRFVPPAEKR